MLLRTRSEIPSSEITPKGTYEAFQCSRRSVMAGLGAMGAAAAMAGLPSTAQAEAKLTNLVTTSYTVLDRATTPEAKAKSYIPGQANRRRPEIRPTVR